MGDRPVGGAMNPPMDIPAGRMAAFADPQGALFSVLRHTEPTD